MAVWCWDVKDVKRCKNCALHHSQGEWSHLEPLVESNRGDLRLNPGVLKSGIQRILGPLYYNWKRDISSSLNCFRNGLYWSTAPLSTSTACVGLDVQREALSTHRETDATCSKQAILITQVGIGNPNTWYRCPQSEELGHQKNIKPTSRWIRSLGLKWLR